MSDKAKLDQSISPYLDSQWNESDNPMVVMTDPVTMAGKNRASLEKTPEIRNDEPRYDKKAPNIAPLP